MSLFLPLLTRNITTHIRMPIRLENRQLYTMYSCHKNMTKTPFLTINESELAFASLAVPLASDFTETSPLRVLPRHFSTKNTGVSLMKTIKRKVGLGYRYPKYTMRLAGLKLYMCCSELVDYDELFDYLDIPDTFFSYFLLLQIHVWLVIGRVAQEGDEGAFVKRHLTTYMWEDLDAKTKKLAQDGLLKNRREGLAEMHPQFSAAMFSYDEGSLCNDVDLAASLWRILFQKNCQDPVKLAKIVHYIRKQIAHIDSQKTEFVLKKGLVTFLPFEGERLDYDSSTVAINRILLGVSNIRK